MQRLTLVLVIALFVVVAAASGAEPVKPRTIDLNVAIFAYLPDASAAIERLEEAFERKHETIDIDFELWNPYKDKLGDDGLEQIGAFDIVEIDVCRIEQLIAGHVGGIEELPVAWRGESGNFVGPAKAILKTDVGKYVVPHWVCGNFLLLQGENKAGQAAKNFDDLLAAMDPARERPLHAAMGGRTGLGEIYADALCDRLGPAKAREHLIKLADAAAPTLDPDAEACVLKLAGELAGDNQKKNREHFDNHNYVHPRRFALQPQSFLLGYSERLYFAERELQLNPKTASVPVWKAADIEVRQFPFADKSQGTPTWTDGFVVPKGKLTVAKKDAIEKFLTFVTSSESYLVFAEPAPYLAASYLLPAPAAAYADAEMQKKQPLLAKFKTELDESFPVYEVKVWQGMRNAGSALNELLNH